MAAKNQYTSHTGTFSRGNLTVLGTRKVLYAERQRIGCWFLAENTRRGHDMRHLVATDRKCRTRDAVRRKIKRMFKGAPQSLT